MKDNAFDLYQGLAGRTRNIDLSDREELANYALGLVSEAGEVGDIIKKHLYHGHELDLGELVKECGDTLWYLANLVAVVDIELSEVATKNIDKLKNRYPGGFSHGASINRAE